MRKLITADLMAAMRLVKSVGLRDELKRIIDENEGKDARETGIDGVLSVLELCGSEKAEAAIYGFLARPLEITPEEIAALPLPELAENLRALWADGGGHDFFTCLSGMISRN